MTEEIIDGEVWKAYPHDQRYMVSSMGRVVGPSGKVLKGGIGSHGYPAVAVGKNNIKLVHRMVLETFDPENKSEQVCHNDGDRKNCKLENLRWGTVKENQNDRKSHGTHFSGQDHHLSKLTETEVEQIKQIKNETKLSDESIGSMFGASRSTVQRIRTGRLWPASTRIERGTALNQNTLSAEVG